MSKCYHTAPSATTVLQVCEPIASGVAIHVGELVMRLQGRGFRFVVACPSDSTLNDTLRHTGAEVCNIEMRRGLHPVSDFRAAIQLVALMRRCQPDIVHLHSSKAGLIGRLPARLLGIPTVFTPHSFSFTAMQSRVLTIVSLLAERLLGHVTDCLICVSSDERATAIQRGIARRDRVVYIPNFVDLRRWSPQPPDPNLKRSLSIPESHRVVGTVSRFFKQKAPLDFVSMAQSVARVRSDVSFLFVGQNGPLREQAIRNVDQAGLTDRVVFHGWTDNVPDMVALMDVFVLNSLWEGLPFTVIEAMAMAKPVIATDIPGIRELLLPATRGILVPPSRPEVMAEAVLRVLDEPHTMQSLGNAARVAAASRYNAEHAIERMRQVYQGIAHFPTGAQENCAS